MQQHRVRALLMGGQACVFYGGAEFSRDTDLAILADTANIARLRKALKDLEAEVIAVPPFGIKYLRKGHAIHFRCQNPEALRMRVDVMSKMRGVDPFPKLWQRRTTIELPDKTICHLLSLPDLVRAKKTQRDKDWPMIRRLVEADYLQNWKRATREQVRFWLLELRTPVILIELSALNVSQSRRLASKRPLLHDALLGNIDDVQRMLADEEAAEREEDQLYWLPLRKELEALRHERFNSSGQLSSVNLTRPNEIIVSAIRNKEVLKFNYAGKIRIVEPQTYGLSTACREVLRAYQKSGGSRSGQTKIAKLFDLEKISSLEKTGEKFTQALPEHNPQDSAMVEVFASLPKPGRKSESRQ